MRTNVGCRHYFSKSPHGPSRKGSSPLGEKIVGLLPAPSFLLELMKGLKDIEKE